MSTSTTTSSIGVTQGSGKSPATFSFTEDAITKEGQRVFGQYNSSAPTLSTGNGSDLQLDVNANLKETLGTLIAGENLTTNRMMVEHAYIASRKTADGQVAAAAGFLHLVTISPTTASPTAGLVTVYDNTAESGTVLYTEWVFATTPGHSVPIDVAFSTGCYIGFDATLANVAITASYRLT